MLRRKVMNDESSLPRRRSLPRPGCRMGVDGDVRKAVHHCADDQIYPWKLQGILS
jgi:hypothetical protein